MPYSDPSDPDHVEIFSYADPDALLELYGHVRASNPQLTVRIRTANRMRPDDYIGHLAILGGTDWNTATRDLISRLGLPVRMALRDGRPGSGTFEVGDGTRFSPVLLETPPGRHLLAEDVTFFFRGTNPFNAGCTVTICAGLYARGTLAAVGALTDPILRGRNESYVRTRFANSPAFGILARAHVVNEVVMPPDWSVTENRLYEWPE
jgi:hypothetical protein